MHDLKKVEFIESYWKIGNADYQWNDNHGELIRCKDCKWHTMRDKMLLCTAQDTPHTYDWFCADGERRDTDA